ncbi:TIGR03854 family LLM class F420-dependent oxidoreductase [Pseudonocardia sp. GCM10023141]|uniref:TIGR03854 family LLM class F420-dependent oxidoreductase n=1 Tax=Pseudonocardia sp. GCM10023141 TaxID=3252653 RepID=UPI00361C79E4
MSVRIGIGSIPFGDAPGPALAELVDVCEALRIDSIWLPDQASENGIDPLVGMAYAAGRTTRLKVGTGVLVLPGRNPMLVAAQLASLAALAPRRILPVFGLRSASPAERTLFPVPAGQRAALFDEALLVVRRLLTEPSVTHHGRFFQFEGAAIAPLSARPLDLWLAGKAPAGLARVGRFGDGWLGSFVTPEEAGACRRAIEEAAAAAGREIEDDHYGTNIAVLPPGTPDAVRDIALQRAAERRPELDPRLLVADGWAVARERIRQFVDVGLTKFVVRPATAVGSWRGFLDGFAAELAGVQT